jgi:PAS domain S-box-containing protein
MAPSSEKRPPKPKKIKKPPKIPADAPKTKKKQSAPARTGRQAAPVLDENEAVTGEIETIGDITALQQIKLDFHERQSLLNSLIENLPNGIIIVSFEGTVLFANMAAARIVGMPRPEAGVGAKISRFIAPESLDQTVRVLATIAKTGGPLTTELQLRKVDGNIIWVEAMGVRITYQNKPADLVTIRDITSRKKMQDQIAANEERLRALLHNASDIIRVLDRTGKIVFDTAASERVLGYPLGYTIGKSPFEFIHPDDAEMVKKELSEVYSNANTGVPTEFRLRKADGSYAWVESVGKNLSGVPGIDGIVITTRFIDERKKSEQALQNQHNLALALTTCQTMKEALELTLDAALQAEGLDSGGIYMADPVTGALDIAVHRGLSPEFVEHTSHFDADALQVERAKTGTPFYGRYADIRPTGKDELRDREGITALASIPVLHGGNLVAIMNMASHIHDDIPILTHHLLETLATQISGALVYIHSEEALKESERRMREIVDNAPFGAHLYELGAERRLVFIGANRAADSILGVRNQQFVGKTIEEAFPPLSQTDIPDAYRQVAATGGQYDVDQVDYADDGGIRGAFEVHAFQTGPNRMATFFHDITERKRVEENLRVATEKYTKAFLSTPDAITVSDLESGLFIEVNDAASRIFGYSRDELVGKNSLELGIWPDKEVRDAMVDKIRAQGRIVQYEVVERRKSGELFNASVSADTISIGNTRHLIATTRDITDRKQVEDELRESEARYSSLFSNNYSVSLLIDPDTGMIVDANDAASQYYGFSKEQLISMGIYDINRLPKEKVVRNLIHAKGEKAKHFFSTHYLANGERRNVEIFSGPIAVQGKPLFYSIIHDITDRVKAEQALRNSEAQMNMILQGSPIPKFVIDTHHRIISWNKALEETSGIKAQDVIGTSMHWKAFYENARPLMADLLVDGALDKIPQLYAGKYRKSEIAEGGYEATDFFPHMGKNGRWLHFVAAPIRDFGGKIIGAIESLEDITGLMEAQHSLRESEERYRTLIDQLPDYVIVHRNGILLYVNPAAARHLRYETQELIGKPVTLFIEPGYHDMVKKAIIKRMAGEDVPPYEMMITAHDGTSRAVLVNGAQVHYEDAPASLNVLTDITVIKEAEKVIRQANEDLERRVAERTESLSRTNVQLEQEIKARNAAEREIHKSLEEKDLLLREIHHRVKNNLQIISSMLNLQSRTIKDENVLDAIKDSQSRVRAMALVHERIYRSHNIGEIDLPEYLQYLVKQLFMFHNIPHAKVAITFRMEPVTADIDTIVPIGLIINEMVSNSLKHAFPGERKGRITIEGSNPTTELLKFTYRDDGVGIPEDINWKNPTSLGLRLITSLVEQLSGEITMERDAGTVFAFTVHPKKPVKVPGAEEKHE